MTAQRRQQQRTRRPAPPMPTETDQPTTDDVKASEKGEQTSRSGAHTKNKSLSVPEDENRNPDDTMSAWGLIRQATESDDEAETDKKIVGDGDGSDRDETAPKPQGGFQISISEAPPRETDSNSPRGGTAADTAASRRASCGDTMNTMGETISGWGLMRQSGGGDSTDDEGSDREGSSFQDTKDGKSVTTGTGATAAYGKSAPAPANPASAPRQSILGSVHPAEPEKTEIRLGAAEGKAPTIAVDRELVKQWKYEKIKELGRGAFGSVFLAHNITIGKIMAVKRVELSKGITPEIARELENEINVMRKLNNPHIVQIMGCIILPPNRMEIYMEYVDGNSLDSQVKTFGPFPEQIIQYYTTQMLQALVYIHGSGVIHRDIKGKNILVMGKGTVKLADFGSAKVLDKAMMSHAIGNGLELDETFKFTPQWVAPEVLKGRWDQKVDIWSLGCVVLEMASARAPWHEKNLQNTFQIMYQISQTEEIPQLPDQLSEEGIAFCERCFERDPRKRPSAKDLLTDPWVVEMWKPRVMMAARKVAQNQNSVIKVLQRCGIKCTLAQKLADDYAK